MRPSAPALLAVLAGLVAAAASTSSTGDGVSGTSDTFSVTLDEGTTLSEDSMVALLDAQVEIADDGEINLTASFDETPAFIAVTLRSETTGEQTTTDVDTSVQLEVSIGIAAFLGCDGLSLCEEELTVSFERLDEETAVPVAIDWSLDGFVSVLDAEAGSFGTLTFNPG